MLRSVLLAAAAGVAFCAADRACAQANANAVTSASDAFGFKSGDESVGIYDETSVRGFNLEAAGNYRVNGTYFVRNSGVSPFFLESTSVRIGYNTLSTILPGPSGIVDYRLRDPKRGEPSALTVGFDFFSQPYAELHLKHRSADDRSSYSLGINRVFDVRDLEGGHDGESVLVAGAGRLTVGPAIGHIFFGEYEYERAGLFRVVPAADALPRRIERGRYLGQNWSREEGQRRIAGLLVDASLSDRAGIGATAVFSQEDPTRGFTQLFSDFRADGTARATMVVIPQQRSTAWSGELRAHVERPLGDLAQRVDLTLRGRLQRARIGGSRVLDLGRSLFGNRPSDQPAPAIDDGAANLRDQVDQWGIGLTYRASLRDRLRLNLGVLRTDYRKTFVGADGNRQRGRAKPWLYNTGIAWRVAKGLELYGSYSRGLEEAGVAPATATNRNEVLSAIRVTQRELGLRFTTPRNLALVVAGFDTRKPYAGIDGATGAYRLLGQVRHRGIEASLSGRPSPGLSVVVGGVLIDPQLSGAEVEAGRIGDRPVGVPRLRAIASADYELPFIHGLSVDAGANFVGARPARSRIASPSAEQLRVPAIATLNLGLRYRFRLAGHDLVARAQAQNLFNQYSWDVNSSETLAYSPQRRYRLVLTAPF